MIDKVHQNVLVLCEPPETRRLVLEALAARAARGLVAADLPAAWRILEQTTLSLALLTAAADAAAELAFVSRFKALAPDVPVVLIGRQDSASAAVAAMRAGCHDYLAQPLDRPRLAELVEALLPNHDVPLAAADQEDTRCLYQIAGRSPPLLEMIDLASRVAPTSVPVLITGESGTGKELLSYLIHRRSLRAAGPYVRVNCAAISDSLLESELFGHERGAFTGAISQRKGRLERAHGGTLLLDEISETGPRLQAELLRVLETQDFERVGGSQSLRTNVRLVSTTNRDLEREVRRGRFRADLYYRIGGVQLAMPPLRERPADIPVLVWHFVNQYAREVRRKITALDEGMLELFRAYAWPGNVRQLRNMVRAALVLGDGPVLSLPKQRGLHLEVGEDRDESRLGAPQVGLSLDRLEREAIVEAVRRTNRCYTEAARLLGISDRTLRDKLKRYRREGLLDEPPRGPQTQYGAFGAPSPADADLQTPNDASAGREPSAPSAADMGEGRWAGQWT